MLPWLWPALGCQGSRLGPTGLLTHSTTTVCWGSSSRCSLACHALLIKREVLNDPENSVWLQHLLSWCCLEHQTEGREEAHGDLLVTSTSVLLSLLPLCGHRAPTARKPSSAKDTLGNEGYPFFACLPLRPRITEWQTAFNALSVLLIVVTVYNCKTWYHTWLVSETWPLHLSFSIITKTKEWHVLNSCNGIQPKWC